MRPAPARSPAHVAHRPHTSTTAPLAENDAEPAAVSMVRKHLVAVDLGHRPHASHARMSWRISWPAWQAKKALRLSKRCTSRPPTSASIAR
jgi:hypothetical protein